MNVLKEQGLSINREGKDYISAIAPDSGMKMRFRGDFYAWDWTLKAAPEEKSKEKEEALLLPQLQEDTIHDRNRTDADANLKRMEENCNARLTALSTRLDIRRQVDADSDGTAHLEAIVQRCQRSVRQLADLVNDLEKRRIERKRQSRPRRRMR